MEQLNLFPPLGAIKEPLSRDVLREARELLAELLIEVMEAPEEQQQPSGEGEAHE